MKKSNELAKKFLIASLLIVINGLIVVFLLGDIHTPELSLLESTIVMGIGLFNIIPFLTGGIMAGSPGLIVDDNKSNNIHRIVILAGFVFIFDIGLYRFTQII